MMSLAFESCVLFLEKMEYHKKTMDMFGKDYCIFTMNIKLNDEEFCSENILASKNCKLLDEP